MKEKSYALFKLVLIGSLLGLWLKTKKEDDKKLFLSVEEKAGLKDDPWIIFDSNTKRNINRLKIKPK